MKYLPYLLTPLLMLIGTTTILAGSWFTWLGFVIVIIGVTLSDVLGGEDTNEPDYTATWFFDAGLYLILPLIVLHTTAFAWMLGNGDLLSIGAGLQLVGIDIFAARAELDTFSTIGMVLTTGMLYGAVGTNVAHELIHRTWSAKDLVIGRWLLTFSYDCSFAIEHVYGHHKNIATRLDPATARRGDNLYPFLLRSTVNSYRHAWQLEKERLAKTGHSVWGLHSRMLRGNLMCVFTTLLFFAAAGWVGGLVFIITCLYAKFWLEAINYIEHYGIVRVPGKPVEPKHSWNSNKRLTTWLLYNLPRHSHHHAMGEKPFWELRAYPGAPMLPTGYMGMVLLALVPPLWHAIMDPKVLEWDQHYAAADELPYIEEANRLSGRAIFSHSTARYN